MLVRIIVDCQSADLLFSLEINVCMIALPAPGGGRAADSPSDFHFTETPAWLAASSLLPSAVSAENM